MTDKQLVIDFDGTLVENVWPGIGDFMPGAIKEMRQAHEDGWSIVLFSARLSPVNPFTGNDRPPGEVAAEVQKVRAKLDAAGLSFIKIWTKGGKPGGFAYIDDRAERYVGTKHAWAAVMHKVNARWKHESAS